MSTKLNRDKVTIIDVEDIPDWFCICGEGWKVKWFFDFRGLKKGLEELGELLEKRSQKNEQISIKG